MLHDYFENICAMNVLSELKKVGEEKERISFSLFFMKNSENRKRFWKTPEKLTKRQTKKQTPEAEVATSKV